MAAGCNMEEGGVDEYDIMYRVTDTGITWQDGC